MLVVSCRTDVHLPRAGRDAVTRASRREERLQGRRYHRGHTALGQATRARQEPVLLASAVQVSVGSTPLAEFNIRTYCMSIWYCSDLTLLTGVMSVRNVFTFRFDVVSGWKCDERSNLLKFLKSSAVPCSGGWWFSRPSLFSIGCVLILVALFLYINHLKWLQPWINTLKTN